VPRYTDDSRDRVRDAVDMLVLVESKVELSRKGHNSYFGLCPFHNESSPSFHVRPEEKHYHCFGCGVSGDPFTFLMELGGLDFVGAMEELAGRFGVQLETVEESPQAAAERARRERLYSLLSRASAYYERYLWESSEAEAARKYLTDRGLDEAVLRDFQVGYAPDSWDRLSVGSVRAGYTNAEIVAAGLAQPKRKNPAEVLDRFRGRIMFPTADFRGRIRGFGARVMVPSDREAKYINTAEGELYHKREVLYGIDKARPHATRTGRMVLCEGYTDVIAMHQAGIPWSVGIMGTSLTQEQVSELVRSVKTLLLCLDADNAGQDAAVRAAGLASEQGLELRVVPLPAGSDPADLLREQGAESLRKLVEESVPYVVFEVERTLSRADLANAEGKDRAIAELRPAFARLGPSVLRDDLVRRAAGRLEITEARLNTLLGEAAPAPPPRAAGDDPGEFGPPPWEQRSDAGPGNRSESGSARARRPTRKIQHERSFLAVAVAAPSAGAEALAKSNFDLLFTDPMMQAAARHIAGCLPSDVTIPDDPELAAIVADLVDRAARGRVVGSDEVEHARLVLEHERISEELRYAREHGGVGIAELKGREQQIQKEIRAVVGRQETPH
jgi:DNA primase